MKNIKLGHVMTVSRLLSFVGFLTATFAWILGMYPLFTLSAIAFTASAVFHAKKQTQLA